MDQTQIQSPDVYGRTFQMDEVALGAIANRLEARGKHPFFLRAIDEYMAALSLTGAESILDIGCGTGVAARTIARRADVRGRLPRSTLAPTSWKRASVLLRARA